MIEDGIFLKEF